MWFSSQRLPPVPNVVLGNLPRRWVVERTFRWLRQNRRFSRDYERLLRHQRGTHLCRHESFHGPEVGENPTSQTVARPWVKLNPILNAICEVQASW